MLCHIFWLMRKCVWWKTYLGMKIIYVKLIFWNKHSWFRNMQKKFWHECSNVWKISSSCIMFQNLCSMFWNLGFHYIYTCFETPVDKVSKLSNSACCISKHLWDLSLCFETYMVRFETSDIAASRALKIRDTSTLYIYLYPKAFQKIV